jgi:uncharacterized protein RhaS with RHS repeats
MQYHNRYYDAGLGRFLSRDPAQYSDSLALYVYVSNRSVNRTDPSGRVGVGVNLGLAECTLHLTSLKAGYTGNADVKWKHGHEKWPPAASLFGLPITTSSRPLCRCEYRSTWRGYLECCGPLGSFLSRVNLGGDKTTWRKVSLRFPLKYRHDRWEYYLEWSRAAGEWAGKGYTKVWEAVYETATDEEPNPVTTWAMEFLLSEGGAAIAEDLTTPKSNWLFGKAISTARFYNDCREKCQKKARKHTRTDGTMRGYPRSPLTTHKRESLYGYDNHSAAYQPAHFAPGAGFPGGSPADTLSIGLAHCVRGGLHCARDSTRCSLL